MVHLCCGRQHHSGSLGLAYPCTAAGADMSAFTMRIRGRITCAICSTTTHGHPVIAVRLTDATGQEIRARRIYTDTTPASHYAAASLARSLTGNVADIEAHHVRFRAKRLDCDATAIQLTHPIHHRKDLE